MLNTNYKRKIHLTFFTLIFEHNTDYKDTAMDQTKNLVEDRVQIGFTVFK